MPHTLSPEQEVVTKSILRDPTSDTKYFDLDTAFGSVYKAIIFALNNNKKILLHIPSESQSTIDIEKLIRQYHLDSLSIDIGSISTIPESDIITLRSVLKKGVDTTPIINHIINSESLEAELRSSAQFYDSMDKKILSDRTFRELTSSLIYQQNNQSTTGGLQLIIKDLTFTIEEYYEIKNAIKSASVLYKKEFDLLDNLELLSAETWSLSKEQLNNLRIKLDTLIKENNQLKSDYNYSYQTLSSHATEEINLKLKSLQQAVQAHQLECTSYHINSIYQVNKSESKFSLFSKKQSKSNNTVFVKAFDEITGTIKNISTDWYDTIATATEEDLSYEYIIKFLNKIKKEIPIYQLKLKQSLSNTIHRINRINTHSESVKTLDNQLSNFIKKIDEMSFINQKFNANTLSFMKQMKLNDEISKVLSHCYNLIGKDSEYITWKIFEKQNQDLVNQIIDQLKAYPTSAWNDFFENWYNNQIKAHILANNSIDETKISSISQLNEKILNNEIDAAINKIQTKRISAAEFLKSNTKEIYNTLFKKKTLNPTSWKEIAITSRPFLQDFFPIHIDKDLSYSDDYDLVLSFSRRPAIMTEGSKVHHLSPISSGDIESRNQTNDLFLFLNSYQYSEPLAELPTTEKLKASKKLAKFILSLNQQVKIYQIKSGNIISLLPINDDSYFEKRMEKFGIKSIDTSGTLYDKLTESILFTNRQPFLIIKDELINPTLHKHLLWQANLLQTFRTAGYKVLSINTADQLNNNKETFDRIINSMIDNTEVNSRTKETTESTSVVNDLFIQEQNS